MITLPAPCTLRGDMRIVTMEGAALILNTNCPITGKNIEFAVPSRMIPFCIGFGHVHPSHNVENSVSWVSSSNTRIYHGQIQEIGTVILDDMYEHNGKWSFDTDIGRFEYKESNLEDQKFMVKMHYTDFDGSLVNGVCNYITHLKPHRGATKTWVHQEINLDRLIKRIMNIPLGHVEDVKYICDIISDDGYRFLAPLNIVRFS